MRWCYLTTASGVHPPSDLSPHSNSPPPPLSRLGFKVNAFGGETVLDVGAYSYSGFAKRSLRQTIDRARRVGAVPHKGGVRGALSAPAWPQRRRVGHKCMVCTMRAVRYVCFSACLPVQRCLHATLPQLHVGAQPA